jgi:hypothetical protein
MATDLTACRAIGKAVPFATAVAEVSALLGFTRILRYPARAIAAAAL